MKIDSTLSAVVAYSEGKGRCTTVTTITIMLGSLIPVARKTLGGHYSQEQGMAEFRRNPKSFQRLEGYITAQELRLVA